MRPSHLSAALAFGAASLSAAGARAGTLCTDATMVPNPVYVVGSTAVKPVVLKIAAYLAVQSAPISVVYGGTGSCAGVSSVIDTALGVGSGTVLTPSGQTGYFTYYDSTGTAQSCDIFANEAGAGVSPDIGLSDVYADSCQTLPQTLGSLAVSEHLGPVQAMVFAVPENSSALSISGPAAFFVYGFGAVNGATNTVSPWSDLMSIYQRGATSGTQAMIAKAIAVPNTSWYGVTPKAMSGESGTQAMIRYLNMAATGMNANAIGILGTADIDPVRRSGTGSIRALAYKHFGQNCGYLPDSDPTHYDKQNVRDGHYAIWGPLHVFTLPTSSSKSGTIVTYLTGFAQLGTTDVIAAEAQAGLVPQCAMRVQRSTELGGLSPVTQPAPCGCYYEKSASTTGTTSCAKCQVTSDCQSGYSCQTYGTQGYCEAP